MVAAVTPAPATFTVPPVPSKIAALPEPNKFVYGPPLKMPQLAVVPLSHVLPLETES